MEKIKRGRGRPNIFGEQVTSLLRQGRGVLDVAKSVGCSTDVVRYYVNKMGGIDEPHPVRRGKALLGDTILLDGVDTRGMNQRQVCYAILANYLAAHSCVDCGESDIVVLEFDHRGGKVKAVSRFKGYKIETLMAEIAKCDVVCCNCHRRRTARQFGSYRLDYMIQAARDEEAPDIDP